MIATWSPKILLLDMPIGACRSGQDARFSLGTVLEMVEETIDRRVARSRAALHKALMSLILKKRYEAVIITDICGAAER
jgi:hypothetical protein